MDGAPFTHKYRPWGSAGAPRTKVWLKRDEKLRITVKWKHNGASGKSFKFMVGVSYGKGLAICEPYEKMNSKSFASFIKRVFPQAFLFSAKGPRRLLLQDNDPTAQSAACKKEWKRLGAEKVHIHPSSPDLI